MDKKETLHVHMFERTAFVRLGEEIYFASSHRAIMIARLGIKTDSGVIELIKDSEDLDMGAVFNSADKFIQIGDRSTTYNYPDACRLPIVRKKTIDCFTARYNNSFKVVDRIDPSLV